MLKQSFLWLLFYFSCVRMPSIAMTRKSKHGTLLQRNPSSTDALRMDEADFAEHGLRAAYRAGSFVQLGYAGVARNSDRVSTDHFLSELDKACCREKQVN